MPAKAVLLGPQPVDAGADVGQVLREQGIRERVALITAGWQEYEAEDAGLVGAMGVPAVNLRLAARAEEVFATDAALTTAYQERQELLRHIQGFYRIRLDYADDAAKAISVRHVEPELLEAEARADVEVLRDLDFDHLERCRAVHKAFEERWKPGERPVVARHRAEVRSLVKSCAALVIAGGHVASLLNRMKLFDVIKAASGKPVIAWSAGAMVLTERIVLFHDFPPYGKDVAQVLDAGFGLVKDVVVLPNPRRRIKSDERAGISRFAQRMAPAQCIATDRGARVVFERNRIVSANAELLAESGEVQRWTR